MPSTFCPSGFGSETEAPLSVGKKKSATPLLETVAPFTMEWRWRASREVRKKLEQERSKGRELRQDLVTSLKLLPSLPLNSFAFISELWIRLPVEGEQISDISKMKCYTRLQIAPTNTGKSPKVRISKNPIYQNNLKNATDIKSLYYYNKIIKIYN